MRMHQLQWVDAQAWVSRMGEFALKRAILSVITEGDNVLAERKTSRLNQNNLQLPYRQAFN